MRVDHLVPVMLDTNSSMSFIFGCGSIKERYVVHTEDTKMQNGEPFLLLIGCATNNFHNLLNPKKLAIFCDKQLCNMIIKGGC